MASFTKVTYPCHRCLNTVIFETQVGEEKMLTALSEIPVEVAQSLHNFREQCQNCGLVHVFECPYPIMVKAKITSQI